MTGVYGYSAGIPAICVSNQNPYFLSFLHLPRDLEICFGEEITSWSASICHQLYLAPHLDIGSGVSIMIVEGRTPRVRKGINART